MSLREMTKEIVAVISLVCLLLFLSSPKTYASEVYLRLAPTVVTIHPQEDGVVEKKISVQNTGPDPVSLTILLKPFSATEKGEIFYPQTKVETDVAGFITNNVQVLENDIPVSSISLAPGQIEQLTLYININNLQNISEYTFSLFFISTGRNNEYEKPEDQSIISSQLQLHLGSAIHILITGKNTTSPHGPVAITSFATKSFFEHGPVPFSIQVKNVSPRYEQVYGTILITNMFSQQVGLIRIPSQIILSNSQKTLSNAKSQSGNIISWDQGLLIGPYTAKLTVTNDEGREKIESLRFFVFPTRAILFLLFLLLFINVVFSEIKKRLK